MKIKYNGKLPQQDPIFLLLFGFFIFCLVLLMLALVYNYATAADAIPYLRK